jgi:hypothetical protein
MMRLEAATMVISFPDHVALLSAFIDGRRDIVERIESSLLNVRGKDLLPVRDRRPFDRLLRSCFFGAPGVPRELARLDGQLAAARLADGFEPVPIDRFCVDLDPLELIPRAYEHWERRHWPGRSGRLTYAQTIFYVYVLRQLEHLSLRMWDDGCSDAGNRLDNLQRLLDRLNDPGVPAPFVRDVRWLVQTAQGPLTRDLAPYFTIADRISRSFIDDRRLELHRAGAMLIGGHLRSQLRYRTWEQNRAIDDPAILAITRNSNSMDGALLVGELVPLLEAYDAASAGVHGDRRLDFADAILQGISADPELFLTRLDLLAPCTTIEALFIERDAHRRPRRTPLGERYLRLVERFGALVGRLAGRLVDDADALAPSRGVYSPFGIAYGFCADILSNMAGAALVSQPAHVLSLEDVFASRGRLVDNLARARGWAALPRRPGEREHWYHSMEWAEEIFARLVEALRARAGRPAEPNASAIRSAHLFVRAGAGHAAEAPQGEAEGPVSAHAFAMTTDPRLEAAGAGVLAPASQILNDRDEGRFLASVEVDGHWFAVSKILLTVVTAQGRDALISHVPPPAADILNLTCAGLVAPSDQRP